MQYKYVIGYLRLSQDDEDKNDESNSIKNQRLLIQQFINGNEEFQGAKTVFFSDDGYSGTNFNRPDFKKMMELVKAESSCCVIVKDLSRLGRDTIDTQQYIEKIFPFLLVRFIAINDYYDSSAPLASRKDKVMGMVETGAAYHGPQKIPKNIFRYKLKCGYCGRALRVRSENKTPAMGCSTSKVSQNTKCYAGQYKTAEFEKLFLKLVQREAALAEDTLKQIKQVSKTQNLSKLKSRKKGCEEKVQKVKQQKMEFYEAFVDGKVTKEGYLRKKELLTQKEHRYKELITELQEQIIQAEEKRKLAKSPELLAFSKCKDLTELSYEVIQELVEVIYFYDPEHIEVIWKYRDEFLEAEKALAE